MSRTPEISPITGGGSLMVAWRVDRQQVLVVGGGPVAAGRVRLALEADARVVVVAPDLGAELRARHARGEFVWRARPFRDADLDGAQMVMTAIDDPQESLRIGGLCRAARIPVNVADVPYLCDFWFTSVHREGPVQIAVSSNGKGPSITSRLIRQLANQLPAGLGDAVAGFGRLRDAIRQEDPAPESSSRRMSWLGKIGRGWAYDDLAHLDEATVAHLVRAYSDGGAPPDGPPRGGKAATSDDVVQLPSEPSDVLMVGAGPGDPRMLTVEAARALAEADVVVADRLIAPEILDLIEGELRIARKLPGRSHEAQREIEDWVVGAARAGRRVVRLKQGDPFVFGRANEELDRFAAEGLRVRVLPGISSALAAPLVAGVPLTCREVADRFVVATGQGADGKRVDVSPYDPQQTLVLLMAVSRADELAEQMRARGYPADLPVALVERATQPGERIIRCKVADLATTVQRQNVCAPAVIIVGWVAAEGVNRSAQAVGGAA